MTRADLMPTLWITGPGGAAADPAGRPGSSALEPIRHLLEGAESHGADLGRLTVCVAVEAPPSSSAEAGPGTLGEVLAGLRRSIPAGVRRVVVVLPRVRLHVAQGDAFELADAVARRSFAWPVAHCAGNLALRQVGGWWREPGLSRRAGNRFETILGQLARPTGPVYVRRDDSGPLAGERGGLPESRARRDFDTTLFRRRSLFRSPSPTAGPIPGQP